jgi:hypothetical protein
MIPQSSPRKITRLPTQNVEYFAHLTIAPTEFPPFKKIGKDFLLSQESTRQKPRIMNNNSKILLGFLVGAAVGGALGILLAPDKGSETRRKIVEKGNEVGDSLSSFGDTVKDKFNDVVDGVKGTFSKTRNSMS